MIGERYGKLTVIESAGTNKHQKRLWLCRCDCGKKTTVATGTLRSGLTKSCGCMQTSGIAGAQATHRMSRTRVYNIWIGLRDRCNNPKNADYATYGGRGISYDKRWDTFTNFYADMGEPPPNYSIDRIENDGNYSKANCRWASALIQARNSSQATPVTIGGRTMLLMDWANEVGISPGAMTGRIKRGWTIEEAVTTPKQASKWHWRSRR